MGLRTHLLDSYTQQQRGGAAVRPCPGSTSSSSTISQSLVDGDEEELFSPAFHALPEDHSHLDVHDAPAAMARRRVHEADENAEPPCVSTSSTCTSLGGRGHASGVGADDGVVQAAVLQHEDDVLHGGQELDEEDDEGVFDPFAFIKNLPPLPECVSRHRRVLLPRYRCFVGVCFDDDGGGGGVLMMVDSCSIGMHTLACTRWYPHCPIPITTGKHVVPSKKRWCLILTKPWCTVP